MNDRFMYDNNGIVMKCECDYDYATDTGGTATLISAHIAGWNVMSMVDDDLREDIEDYYLENIERIAALNAKRRVGNE